MTKEELDHCRNVPYFTLDRSRAELWDFNLENNSTEFIAKCNVSEAVFIRADHWKSILGSTTLSRYLNTSIDVNKSLDGHPGNILGCEVYTDAFVNPIAKDKSDSQIFFIPKAD